MSETPVTADSTEQREPESRLTLTPDKALDRLRKGLPVECARIERLVLQGEFTEPIKLKNCSLPRLRIDGATFKGEVQIVGSTLDRPTFQRPCVFEQGLNLSGTTINRAGLHNLTVHGVFNAGNLAARGELQFVRCQFLGLVRFWGAEVDCWAEFKECLFALEADFRSMHCNQGLIFKQCEFRANLSVRGTSVAKKLDLNSSRFAALIDLSRAKLHDFVYLEEIVAEPAQLWAFENTVAERILIHPEQLVGRLESERHGKYTVAMQEYGLFKQSYQNLHRYDQEDWAFYRFKVNQRRGVGRSWIKPWTKFNQFCNWLLLDLGCGYGTNPRRAVLTALLIILLFAGIYTSEIQMLHVEKLPFPDLPLTDWRNRVMIGLTVSVTVFTSGLSSIRDLAQGWMNLPLVFESLLGTLLWGLFVVAFSRKVIR